MCWNGWEEEKKDDVFNYQKCRYLKFTTQSTNISVCAAIGEQPVHCVLLSSSHLVSD